MHHCGIDRLERAMHSLGQLTNPIRLGNETCRAVSQDPFHRLLGAEATDQVLFRVAEREALGTWSRSAKARSSGSTSSVRSLAERRSASSRSDTKTGGRTASASSGAIPSDAN